MAAYGVFLGLNSKKISKLVKYWIVVIEPEEFSAAQVQRIKQAGKKVIAYLNVGAIEKSRSYYKKYEGITLGKYDGWPDERWVDISKASWQAYTLARARKWAEMGYDGFYIDNMDVVEIYKKKGLYKHGKAICKELLKLNKYLLVNGADYFVDQCMKENDIPFNGIQQEEVFTLYDYDNKKYKSQKTVEKHRLKSYCVKVRKRGLDVFCWSTNPPQKTKLR